MMDERTTLRRNLEGKRRRQREVGGKRKRWNRGGNSQKKDLKYNHNWAWKEEEGLKNKTGRERDKIEEIKRIRIG